MGHRPRAGLEILLPLFSLVMVTFDAPGSGCRRFGPSSWADLRRQASIHQVVDMSTNVGCRSVELEAACIAGSSLLWWR